eukprot:7391668-Prymnesium_polylepis.1
MLHARRVLDGRLEMCTELADGREVKDDRWLERPLQQAGESGSELGRSQRIDARLHERCVGFHLAGKLAYGPCEKLCRVMGLLTSLVLRWHHTTGAQRITAPRQPFLAAEELTASGTRFEPMEAHISNPAAEAALATHKVHKLPRVRNVCNAAH